MIMLREKKRGDYVGLVFDLMSDGVRAMIKIIEKRKTKCSGERENMISTVYRERIYRFVGTRFGTPNIIPRISLVSMSARIYIYI